MTRTSTPFQCPPDGPRSPLSSSKSIPVSALPPAAGSIEPLFISFNITKYTHPCMNCRNCAALYGLNHLGPEGYHWRVCLEDKAAPGETGPKTFSWWDIQDENAALPIKEASTQQLHKFFTPPKVDHTDVATKAAKGAFKTLGKAMSHAVGHDAGDQGPPVKVVAFKLLDLVKMHDDFSTKNHGRGGRFPHGGGGTAAAPVTTSRPSHPAAARPPQNMRASAPASVPRHHQQQQQHQQHHQQQQRPPQQAAQSRPPPPQPQQRQRPAQEASLMDFGAGPSTSSSGGGGNFNRAASMPSSVKPPPPSNETRAQKLKREYAQKNQVAQRVWDDIDQRWVEVDAEKKESAPSGGSSFLGEDVPAKKEIGISLDPANAVGKSAQVQAAVNGRVNDMRQSQEKALREVREREDKKKKDEAEEDEVRRRLEPMIKVWSEEHGKKKQLRALLASLHTILWPGAQWKQVTIGDLLDDKKVKLSFHKASRVVHPDKTHHLEAEQRFLAKRIFDALSQAKNEFDDTK